MKFELTDEEKKLLEQVYNTDIPEKDAKPSTPSSSTVEPEQEEIKAKIKQYIINKKNPQKVQAVQQMTTQKQPTNSDTPSVESLISFDEDKHSQDIAKATDRRDWNRNVANIGEVLSQFAMADSVARGGPGTDTRFYDKIRQSGEKGLESAKQTQKEAIARYLRQKRLQSNDDWRQKQFENDEAWKNKTYNLRKQQLDAAKQKEAAKLAPLTHEQKMSGLGGEERKRLDSALMGLEAGLQMEKALKNGDWTFSLIGDNDFTAARARFEDAIGRMQSGGAINSEEAARFKGWAPKPTDTAEMQQKKLKWIKDEMTRRIKNLGFQPDSFGKRKTPKKPAASGGSLPEIK